MNVSIKIPEKIDIDRCTLQKIIFIYNALENGWDIKKQEDKYIFSKKLEQKKEIYLDSYLSTFLESNINIENMKSVS